MRKILLSIAFIFAMIISSNAQEVGVRWGNVTGGNFAVDAVFSAGEFSRIHADVSFGDGVGIDLLWDFLYRPLGGESFNWYMGAGPYTVIDDDFQLGLVGEVGLEYKFNTLPLTFGVDWRPSFRIIDDTDFVGGDFGFNVRIRF